MSNIIVRPGRELVDVHPLFHQAVAVGLGKLASHDLRRRNALRQGWICHASGRAQSVV